MIVKSLFFVAVNKVDLDPAGALTVLLPGLFLAFRGNADIVNS